MEALKSASEMRATSRHIANLEPAFLDAWSNITTSGPVLFIGTVIWTADAWQMLPNQLVCHAIQLHECGCFGAIGDDQWDINDRSISTDANGAIMSLWMPKLFPDFWVITDRCNSGTFTEVSTWLEYAS